MKPQFCKMRSLLLLPILMVLWAIHSGFFAPNPNTNFSELKPIKNPDVLYALSMSRDSFTSLNDKYVLNYYLNSENKYTLEGWQAKGIMGHNYEKLAFTLTVTDSICETINANTHFGNILLYNSEINKVNNKIKELERIPGTLVTKVLFIPKKNLENRMCYLLYIDYTTMKIKSQVLAVAPVEIDANPSPPKKY